MPEPIAFGVDYSTAHPSPVSIVAAGYTVVSRYLGTDSRCLTPHERDDLHAAGLRISLFHQRSQPTAELSVKRPQSGLAGGIEDAQLADTYADRLNVPDAIPLFGVCDVGYGFPTPADYPAIRAYFQGLLTRQRRPVGAYGPYPVLELFRDLEVDGRRVEHFHQTAGGSGSGSGTGGSAHNAGDGSTRRLSSLACAYQEYGGERIPGTDHNQIFMDARTWSWHPDDPTRHKEDDMINWRPVQCPEHSPDTWLTTWDGRGRPRRLKLEDGDGAFFWGLGWVQDVNPIVMNGDAAKRYMRLPEAGADIDGSSGGGSGGITEAQAVAAVAHKLSA